MNRDLFDAATWNENDHPIDERVAAEHAEIIRRLIAWSAAEKPTLYVMDDLYNTIDRTIYVHFEDPIVSEDELVPLQRILQGTGSGWRIFVDAASRTLVAMAAEGWATSRECGAALEGIDGELKRIGDRGQQLQQSAREMAEEAGSLVDEALDQIGENNKWVALGVIRFSPVSPDKLAAQNEDEVPPAFRGSTRRKSFPDTSMWVGYAGDVVSAARAIWESESPRFFPREPGDEEELPSTADRFVAVAESDWRTIKRSECRPDDETDWSWCRAILLEWRFFSGEEWRLEIDGHSLTRVPVLGQVTARA